MGVRMKDFKLTIKIILFIQVVVVFVWFSWGITSVWMKLLTPTWVGIGVLLSMWYLRRIEK
ncbi:MAG TPA: hypothetical protein ENH82_03160 [bacterium]|nr:hypothetical protein [bacterium]